MALSARYVQKAVYIVLTSLSGSTYSLSSIETQIEPRWNQERASVSIHVCITVRRREFLDAVWTHMCSCLPPALAVVNS